MSCACSSCSSGGCSEGLLKFSGVAAVNSGGSEQVSYLPDDFGPAANLVQVPIAYPVASRRKLFNLAVNLSAITIPTDATLTVQLVKDGNPVAGFLVTYTSADTGGGIKTNVATSIVPFTVGATFALKVTTVGFGGGAPTTIALAATVGMSA